MLTSAIMRALLLADAAYAAHGTLLILIRLYVYADDTAADRRHLLRSICRRH